MTISSSSRLDVRIIAAADAASRTNRGAKARRGQGVADACHKSECGLGRFLRASSPVEQARSDQRLADACDLGLRKLHERWAHDCARELPEQDERLLHSV